MSTTESTIVTDRRIAQAANIFMLKRSQCRWISLAFGRAGGESNIPRFLRYVDTCR